MTEINGYNITHTQGDSLTLPITPYTEESMTEIYRLKEGEFFKFSLRLSSGSSSVIEKTAAVQNEDGSFILDFTAEETGALSRLAYIYDIALHGADGSLKITFIGGAAEKAVFKVV